MDLNFPIRHLQIKLDEFKLDLHRLRLYRSESWNHDTEQRIKEYEQAIIILSKSDNCEHPYFYVFQSDTECFCSLCGKDLTNGE